MRKMNTSQENSEPVGTCGPAATAVGCVAMEIEIRLREQDMKAAPTAIRPATAAETGLLFQSHDALGEGMPEPVPEASLVWSPPCAASDTAKASVLALGIGKFKELPRSLRTHLHGLWSRKMFFQIL